jgi:hypothetical protein
MSVTAARRLHSKETRVNASPPRRVVWRRGRGDELGNSLHMSPDD